MDGEITVSSVEGQGSTFAVEIPLNECHEAVVSLPSMDDMTRTTDFENVTTTENIEDPQTGIKAETTISWIRYTYTQDTAGIMDSEASDCVCSTNTVTSVHQKPLSGVNLQYELLMRATESLEQDDDTSDTEPEEPPPSQEASSLSLLSAKDSHMDTELTGHVLDLHTEKQHIQQILSPEPQSAPRARTNNTIPQPPSVTISNGDGNVTVLQATTSTELVDTPSKLSAARKRRMLCFLECNPLFPCHVCVHILLYLFIEQIFCIYLAIRIGRK